MNSLITCLVAGAGYLIHPQKLGSIQETINPDSIVPVTLLTTDEIFGDLETQLHFFDVVDDVFVPEFGSVIVEKPGGNGSAPSVLRAEDLGVHELYHLNDVQTLEGVAELPSGPYFLHGPNLYQAWKLYDDTADAFTIGVIVGKTKTSQFEAGSDWVDNSAPWNPRADGYQTPGGASAGASAALAAYEWLQYSVGRDSIDGVRGSAATQGLFSLRPSTAAIHDGPNPRPAYDTIGLSSHDTDQLFDFAEAVLDLPKYEGTLPQTLIYPEDLFNISGSEKDMHAKFLSTLENFLGIKAKPVALTDIWARKPPPEADGLGMQEYLDEAPFLVFCFDLYHHYESFRDDYRDAFDHDPFVEAAIQFRWNIGKKVSKPDYDKYNKRLDVFRKWFDGNVMSLQKSFDTAMLLPWAMDFPTYRDELQWPPTIIKGITPELLSPILETPQLIVPYAQLPYESRISARTEYRPVSGSLMGPKGGDLMLIQTIKGAFELAAWRTHVDVGRFTFPVGDNSRNIDDLHMRDAAALPLPPMKPIQQIPIMSEL